MPKTVILLSISLLLLGVSCSLDSSEIKESSASSTTAASTFERNGFRAVKTERGISIEDSFRESALTELELPAQRIVLSSTTQLYYFQALGVLDRVIGCPWLDFVKDSEIQDRIKRGQLTDVTGGAGLDLERIISLRPDVLLYDPRNMDFVERIEAAGVCCIPFFEYRETDPVRRSAWIALIAMLTSKEGAAVMITDSIQTSYQTNKVSREGPRPKVLFGSYFQGVWSAAGGGSLIAHMIEDAGGEYVIEGEESAAVDLDLEEFISLLAEVDFIGMIQQGELSRTDWLGLDPRVQEGMIRGKRIFYTNTLASDYFGKGIMEPHIMLQEVGDILSGKLTKGSYFQIAE